MVVVRMVFQAANKEDYWQAAVAVVVVPFLVVPFLVVPFLVVAFVEVACERQLRRNLSSLYLGAMRRRTAPLMRGL